MSHQDTDPGPEPGYFAGQFQILQQWEEQTLHSILGFQDLMSVNYSPSLCQFEWIYADVPVPHKRVEEMADSVTGTH